MDLKQLNDKFNFGSNLELTCSLKLGNYYKLIERLKQHLDELHVGLKESSDASLSILNLLNEFLNPIAYRIGAELIDQYNELALMNRKLVLNLNTKHLDVLSKQRTSLGQLVDQLLSNENLFENSPTKPVEAKQNLYRNLARALESQLDELFSNDLLNLASSSRDQLDENETNLLSLVDEFAKQRTNLLNEWKSQNLKALFDQCLSAFEKEFKKCFKICCKPMRSQRDQIGNSIKDEQPASFKSSFNKSRTSLFGQFDEMEKRYNELIKIQMNTLSAELNNKISQTIQQTADSIADECKLILESSKSVEQSKTVNYRDYLNETVSFKELFNEIHSKQATSSSKQQENVNRLKSNLKELFTKLIAHKSG